MPTLTRTLALIEKCFIFISCFNLIGVNSETEGFIENQEAINYFEIVFDTAAKHAGAEMTDVEVTPSNRRWDSQNELPNIYQRNSRQTDLERTRWRKGRLSGKNENNLERNRNANSFRDISQMFMDQRGGRTQPNQILSKGRCQLKKDYF